MNGNDIEIEVKNEIGLDYHATTVHPCIHPLLYPTYPKGDFDQSITKTLQLFICNSLSYQKNKYQKVIKQTQT